MDHQTALEAANQALCGSALRGASHFASVELRGVGEIRRTGRGVLPPEDSSALPSGAWELAAMISVGLATLLGVLALWFL
jgi:hypothetical protein